jgi:hypothetical protein
MNLFGIIFSLFLFLFIFLLLKRLLNCIPKLVEFKFKLKIAAIAAESTATERVESLLEWVETLVGLLFRVQRIFTVVKFSSLF